MIKCEWCGGNSESRKSCENCAAPISFVGNQSATLYNPRHIDGEKLTSKIGEIIPILNDRNSLLASMMQSSGAYPVQIGNPSGEALGLAAAQRAIEDQRRFNRSQGFLGGLFGSLLNR